MSQYWEYNNLPKNFIYFPKANEAWEVNYRND